MRGGEERSGETRKVRGGEGGVGSDGMWGGCEEWPWQDARSHRREACSRQGPSHRPSQASTANPRVDPWTTIQQAVPGRACTCAKQLLGREAGGKRRARRGAWGRRMIWMRRANEEDDQGDKKNKWERKTSKHEINSRSAVFFSAGAQGIARGTCIATSKSKTIAQSKAREVSCPKHEFDFVPPFPPSLCPATPS